MSNMPVGEGVEFEMTVPSGFCKRCTAEGEQTQIILWLNYFTITLYKTFIISSSFKA